MGNEKYRIGGMLYNLVTTDGGWTWAISAHDWITLEVIQPADGTVMLPRKNAFVHWVKEEGGHQVS